MRLLLHLVCHSSSSPPSARRAMTAFRQCAVLLHSFLGDDACHDHAARLESSDTCTRAWRQRCNWQATGGSSRDVATSRAYTTGRGMKCMHTTWRLFFAPFAHIQSK
eukprot:363785-Chlamydomonas_euryale.AAC.14